MIAARQQQSPFAQAEIENDHRKERNAWDWKQKIHQRVSGGAHRSPPTHGQAKHRSRDQRHDEGEDQTSERRARVNPQFAAESEPQERVRDTRWRRKKCGAQKSAMHEELPDRERDQRSRQRNSDLARQKSRRASCYTETKSELGDPFARSLIFIDLKLSSDSELRIYISSIACDASQSPFDLAQLPLLCASHGFSETIAMSTSSRSEVQISNDSFVYEFQPRISMLRGRGSSTEYSAFIRPGRAVSSTIRSAR